MHSPLLKAKIHVRFVSPGDARAVGQVFYRVWLTTYPNAEVGVTKEDVHEFFKERLTEEGIKRREENIKKLGTRVAK
jgi:hypothetical protein